MSIVIVATAFLVGLVCGCFVVSLCVAAHEGDEQSERIARAIKQGAKDGLRR